MWQFGAKSLEQLRGVRSELVLVVSRALLYSPIDFAVIEGVRSPERQRLLYLKGLSMTMQSKHLTGHAVDLMAIGDLNRDGLIDHQDKAITWDREWYGAIAEAMQKASVELGIETRWGGTFKPNFFDGPHFELV